MAKKIELNLTSVATPKPSAPVLEIRTEGFKERSPCNFKITDLGGGRIIAVSAAGDSFTGTVTEFNRIMRM